METIFWFFVMYELHITQNIYIVNSTHVLVQNKAYIVLWSFQCLNLIR